MNACGKTADRPERLRLLVKRLRRADGLDYDVLERIEKLTSDEQRSEGMN